MKHWLHRWRIARSMDEGRPLPTSTVRKIEADPDLGHHRDALTALERELREEAREWHAQQAPLARVPFAGLAPVARRPRLLTPRLLVAAAAAAVVTTVFLMRAPAPVPAAPAAPVAPVAAGVAAGTPAPWFALDRLAQRAGSLSLLGLRLARHEALVGEARNVARDARRLADTLAGRVTFTGKRSG